ncbi:MAG: hypothetical protein FWE37_05575, partial [Spirochaetaceae bacterium]|nr:hypothetical protein [Spirochaetaceae bacterium]
MLKKIIIVIIVLLAANLAAQEAQLSPEQLFLRFQIESGTLAELQAMAAALGLNSNASLEELRVNLLSYHNLPPTAAESRIVIEQADNFFRGDPSELNEITRLEGNVLLTLIDEDGEHTISAHMVEIDTLNQIIFAGGNVTYQMAGGASFNSNYLIFESDNFSGLIIGFSGSSEAALVADAALIFHYRANLLRRSTNNVLVIDGITITSSRPNDPYYHIRASRLWLLGEGEWAARNLALFIGRVPVFYLPFYYQGDIIFFNPVFGYRLREGFYVNTTTYLLGSKPDGGLLNFNFFNNQTAAAEEPVTLKIMLDYYQRLGFFGGIGFDFAPLNLRSMAGVGFSRSIDEIGNLMEEDYNHSYLFGRQMPFRYGFTLEANHQNRLTIGLNFFSDNRFRSDFFSRSESGLLFGIINFGSFGNFDDATSFADTTTNNSFIRYRNSFTFNNPIVRYLHIDFLNIEINERVRIDTTQHLYNPLRNFYVPTMFNLPNSQFRFGSRYTLNFNNNRPVAGVDESDDNEDDLFYAEDLEEHTFLEEDDEGNLSNLNQPRQPQNWQQAIFYEHTLGSRVFSTPNFNTFNHASEVRFNFDDLRNLTTLRSHVGYSFGTVSSLLRLEHRIGLSAGHQQRFAGDDERTPAEEREDNLARNLNLSHQFTLNYRPFYDNARLNTSQFNYRLNYIFFNNHY